MKNKAINGKTFNVNVKLTFIGRRDVSSDPHRKEIFQCCIFVSGSSWHSLLVIPIVFLALLAVILWKKKTETTVTEGEVENETFLTSSEKETTELEKNVNNDLSF